MKDSEDDIPGFDSGDRIMLIIAVEERFGDPVAPIHRHRAVTG